MGSKLLCLFHIFASWFLNQFRLFFFNISYKTLHKPLDIWIPVQLNLHSSPNTLNLILIYYYSVKSDMSKAQH